MIVRIKSTFLSFLKLFLRLKYPKYKPIHCSYTQALVSYAGNSGKHCHDNYIFSRYKEKLSIWLARYLNVQSLTSSPHSRVMLWGWLKNKMGVSRNNQI
jgi:hypothetical protein